MSTSLLRLRRISARSRPNLGHPERRSALYSGSAIEATWRRMARSASSAECDGALDSPRRDEGIHGPSPKAAVFFSRPLAGERLWRVRVRAPGSEWSTPLPWQPPLQPPPPAQPSAPAVVRSELQLLVLEWSAEEADAEAPDL